MAVKQGEKGFQPLTEAAAGKVAGVASRGSFVTAIGVITATLGSAVGLGNIWKFPSLTGLNGGASFLLVYLLSTLFVGLPVMISELTIGRRTRANAIGALQKVAGSDRTPWLVIGVLGVLSAFFILAFYTEVAGWVFAYIVKSVSGGLLSTDPAVTTGVFTSLITDPVQSLVWQWLVLVLVGFIIILGVSKGIEQTTKRLMPVLFALLLILVVRSLTLPGAGEGLAFLFKPDFSLLTKDVLLAAMGLSFFKLSVGMGTMITYGSYYREDQNIPKTALTVMLADLSVSILAGLAIFPAVFTFGYEPTAGPSLLFITIPSIFASLPFGSVFMVMFFVLAAIAALGAMLSIFEVPVAYLNERFNISRRTSSIIIGVLLALVGSLAALSNSLTANLKLFGLTMFDLFDFTTSNIFLPVGGLLLTIFVGWIWNPKETEDELTNKGVIKNTSVVKAFILICRFVSPVLILIILLNGLGLF
ncbi:MAG: sodium-dependent transporter [Chloroflexi bacterium]|nr:sodium-dependent transporter [Chloroflexota bacterium]